MNNQKKAIKKIDKMLIINSIDNNWREKIKTHRLTNITNNFKILIMSLINMHYPIIKHLLRTNS